MSRLPGLSQWQQTVSTQLPHMSKPQATVLAMWSLGIIIAQSCGLSSVAVILAALFDRTETTIREQLRDWCRDAAHKAGAKHGVKRRSLEVTTCFAPLLRWVVALHPTDCRQLALAMDASTLGQRFTILSIHVVLRGCAIPVAWHIVEATRAGAWRPHWEALFRELEGSVPADWQVIVLADRGVYARWLFHTITTPGWHPMLRIHRQGQYCPADSTGFRPLSQVLTATGQRWAGVVRCFATRERQLTCTRVARWDTGYKDPWLIVTDLPPAQADVAWYGLRTWIEASYTDAKRGGWHWEQTKMVHPRRAERLWLAMAVAMLWVISVGCQAEAMLPVPDRDALPETHIARQKARGCRPPRSVSCFRRGRLVIIAALCTGLPIPTGQLLPEPWPKSLDTHVERPSAYRPLSNAAWQKLYP